jgi:hypothetical protein
MPSGSAPRPRTVAARWRAKCSADCRAPRIVGPGPMALTRTCGASACAAVRVKRPEPHLGDGVAHEFRRQLAHALVDHVDDQPLRLRLAILVGCGRRHLAAIAWLRTNGARRFDSRCRSQLSRVVVSILSYSKIEALFTSTVIGPPSASAARGSSRLHLILSGQIRLQCNGLTDPSRGSRHDRCLRGLGTASVVHGHVVATFRRAASAIARPSRWRSACYQAVIARVPYTSSITM